MADKESKYLIIGGTTKAGTTSLFNYLKDHPDICPAAFKETRFFLDPDYPVKGRYNLYDGIENYYSYFKECSGSKILMEATPDYLYSSNAAENIYNNLSGNARFIFILRDPVDRLKSWYKFAKQNGSLKTDIKFEEYVALQFDNTSNNHDQYMRSLAQGQYHLYLKKYIEVFGEDNVQIIWFDELACKPYFVLQQVCKALNINNYVYKDYKFVVHNKTQSMRFPKIHGVYKKLSRALREVSYHNPVIHKILRFINKHLGSIYSKGNIIKAEEIIIDDDLYCKLVSYYRDDVIKLTELLGCSPPWLDKYK